jgi:SAM-dependent methyltransferase
MRLIDFIHENLVVGRRARVLCSQLADLIPRDSRVLDVGCGDGLIAELLMQQRKDISLSGLDVSVRPRTRIPVIPFDGCRIPYRNDSFNVVMFIDVLHHSENPYELLAEAVRVSRDVILIKDHILKGFMAGHTLRFMDRVGNLRHGVPLRYQYWPRKAWLKAFESIGVQVTSWNQDLRIYPWPARLLFERSLHFIARTDLW